MTKIDLSPTSDSQIVKNRVDSQGFSIVDLGIEANLISEMKEKLGKLVLEDLNKWDSNPYYRDHWMVMNLMFREQIFADLLGGQNLQQFVEPLLGEPFILYSFTSSSMPPNGTNFSRRIHNDAARFVSNYITNVGLVIALDDFTSENGATLVMPYSQTIENKPTDEDFANNAIEIHAKKGQGLIFNARLWHSGGHNKSQNPRNALTLNFCRSFMRQHFDFSRMIDDVTGISLNNQAKKLLGQRVRMPASLEEYYVSTEDRKYQPGQG
jgi:ectoine hydroxylase-related dioxygenase (phytanoyl-CoA dioxygenase family)